MANQVPVWDCGLTQAAATLATKQFHAVKVTGAFAVNLASVAGEAVYGVVQNNPAQGEAATVRRIGVSKAVAGAEIAAGANVMAGADGRLITLAGDDAVCLGVALEGAGAANVVFTLSLIAFGGQTPTDTD